VQDDPGKTPGLPADRAAILLRSHRTLNPLDARHILRDSYAKRAIT